MAQTRKQRENQAKKNGQAKATEVVEPEPEETPKEGPSRKEAQGEHKRAMTYREKHTAKREEFRKIQLDADEENKLREVLRDSLSPEARQLFQSKIVGNPTLCRIRYQKNDGKSYPPGSVRRRDLRLNALRMELKIIDGLTVDDTDRQILVDLAKVNHSFIEIEDLGKLDVGSKEYHEAMSDLHGGLRGELKIQSLWNATDICVLGFAGVMALSVLFDGGLTLATVAEAGLWCGAGYAGHKAIKHRDELMSRYRDFAADHGMSTMQAKEKAVSMMQSAK